MKARRFDDERLRSLLCADIAMMADCRTMGDFIAAEFGRVNDLSSACPAWCRTLILAETQEAKDLAAFAYQDPALAIRSENS